MTAAAGGWIIICCGNANKSPQSSYAYLNLIILVVMFNLAVNSLKEV
jgi:hypothetical protein